MRRGETLVGRYELDRLLGRGGMGEVWLGTDRTLRREIAVKLLYLDDTITPDQVARFEREAVAGAQVSHQNVATIYDHGKDEDVLFLVMEYVAGESLFTVVDREGPLPLPRAVALAAAACAGLAALHDKGVIHCDIKPSNIMITSTGDAKVVDLGIASFQNTPASLVGTTQLPSALTVAYAAPEQLLYGRGDIRSDLYALGTVLFEMLAGQLPFTEPTVLAMMQRKWTEDAPLLDTLVPGVPPILTDLVARLLDRNPARRPQATAEVHQQLTGITAGSDQMNVAPPLRGEPVVMPALGESVTEGTVTRWLKSVGESVEAGEPLLEVSTDKVDTEIPAPASGVIATINVGEHETVAVGTTLAVIGITAASTPLARKFDVVMPELAWGKRKVARWLKHEGQHVKYREPLVEVSGIGRLTQFVRSPATGVLLAIAVAEKQKARGGTRLAVVEGYRPAPAQPSPFRDLPGTPVTMPAFGESVTEGTVTGWLKQVGEYVERDEPLLEMETEKVDTEIPSPAAGILLAIYVAEGEVAGVGEQLCVIG